MSEWYGASQPSPVVKEHFNRIATPLGCTEILQLQAFYLTR